MLWTPGWYKFIEANAHARTNMPQSSEIKSDLLGQVIWFSTFTRSSEFVSLLFSLGHWSVWVGGSSSVSVVAQRIKGRVWRRILPRGSHGWRSLVGYSPWGRKELDTTERLHFTLEKELATHSSILAWKIPWTEEPEGLQAMGSQRVRLSHFTFFPFLYP